MRELLSKYNIIETAEDFEMKVKTSVLKKVEDETWQAMEGFIYNLNSMHSRAGAQIPFSSINLGTDTSRGGRMIIKNFLMAYERGLGKGESPIFPNVCFKLRAGVNFNPEDPNYDLFQLAMRVACKRLQPNFSFQDASFNKPFVDAGEEVATMGCRTRVISNINGESLNDGRGNLSFTTINLPKIALESRNDVDQQHGFWKRLEDAVNLSMKILYTRYKVQSQFLVKDIPFIMGEHLYMGSDKLDPNGTIGESLKNGTLSTGFVGLAECVCCLTGKHHGESDDAQKLGLEIISKMRSMCDEKSQEYKLNFSLLATPAESAAGRLLKMDQKKYGIVRGVTDKEWYTNSFHVPVEYDITSHDKIAIEGPYHKLCNAGHIGYVELSAPPINNIEAMEKIIRCMAGNDFGYGAINFPVDICKECGHNSVIEKECPKCGNGNITRVRRITGYLSTIDQFNSSKKHEVANRKTHQ